MKALKGTVHANILKHERNLDMSLNPCKCMANIHQSQGHKPVPELNLTKVTLQQIWLQENDHCPSKREICKILNAYVDMTVTHMFLSLVSKFQCKHFGIMGYERV